MHRRSETPKRLLPSKRNKQEEEEVAAAAAALAAATPPPPPTTTTAATVTPLACTTTDDPIIPVVLGFGSSDDDDFAGDFAGDGEKKKQDDTVKAIADAAVKAGTVAKETQGDEEAAFVDDDITGNGDIHPILRCEIPWDELDPTLKGHMKILGFRHYSWMGEQGDLPAQFLSPWDQLNDNLQAAAAAFGCDALSWNTWERSVFERPKLSITALESEAAKQKREEDAKENQDNDHLKADTDATKRKGEEDGTNFFLEKNWDDLPKTQQECAILLGHDKSSWNKRNKGKTSSTTKKKSTSLNRTLPIRPTTDNGRMDTTARGQADRALYWAHQWQHTSTYATEKARKARPMLVHGTCSFTKLKRVPVPGSRRINYQAEPMTKGKAIFMVDEYTARDPKKYGKLLLKYGQFLVDGNTERAEVVSDPNSYYNALYTARDGDAKAPRPNDDIIAVKEAERLAENN